MCFLASLHTLCECKLQMGIMQPFEAIMHIHQWQWMQTDVCALHARRMASPALVF